jgi:3-oxoacyl-[acyl-carrier-protein] synthase II
MTVTPVATPAAVRTASSTAARAVVTGIGAVTPLGVGAQSLMARWSAGECGITDGLGRCDDFDPVDFLSKRDRRRSDRYTQLATVAAQEAVAQAGWDELPYDGARIGCVIGTGIGGIGTIYDSHEGMRAGRTVSPMLIPNMMPNAAAASVAIRYGLRGEVFGVMSACASGAHAIGAGLRILAAGGTDAVVVGGAEAALSPLAMTGFITMGAISECGISRPFDRDRDGFVLGEGAAALVLETPQAAASRGAAILGEIVGYGATNDAFHLTAPGADGRTAAHAITRALDDAGLRPADIDYVNAHGTSTPLNDITETLALKAALGEHAYAVPISATKSAIGHTLGAAGAIEAVATLAALRARTAPPTVGLEHPGDGLDLDYVPHHKRDLPASGAKPCLHAISNSFGFGGHNAVLVLRASSC